MTQNTSRDLNNHLFEQLERLNDEELSGESLKTEINRSKAIASVAANIISNGKLALDAQKFKDERMDNGINLPEMLEG